VLKNKNDESISGFSQAADPNLKLLARKIKSIISKIKAVKTTHKNGSFLCA